MARSGMFQFGHLPYKKGLPPGVTLLNEYQNRKSHSILNELLLAVVKNNPSVYSLAAN